MQPKLCDLRDSCGFSVPQSPQRTGSQGRSLLRYLGTWECVMHSGPCQLGARISQVQDDSIHKASRGTSGGQTSCKVTGIERSVKTRREEDKAQGKIKRSASRPSPCAWTKAAEPWRSAGSLAGRTLELGFEGAGAAGHLGQPSRWRTQCRLGRGLAGCAMMGSGHSNRGTQGTCATGLGRLGWRAAEPGLHPDSRSQQENGMGWG